MHGTMMWGIGWTWIFWTIVVVALAVTIGWLLTRGARRGKRDVCPEEHLERRYDHGEISRKEFERRRRILERGPRAATTTGESEETAVDPVCEMTIRRDRASATLEHGEKTYYFCSRHCRDRFQENSLKGSGAVA